MRGATRTTCPLALLAVATALAAWVAAGPAPRAVARAGAGGPGSRPLANRCVVLRTLAGRYVRPAGESYRLGGGRRRGAARFHVKPVRLRRYMLYDQGRRLLNGADQTSIERAGAGRPGRASVWALAPRGPGRTRAVRSVAQGTELTAGPGRRLRLAAKRSAGRAQRFRVLPARGCKRFPEARIGARGRPKLRRRNGSVFGYADIHLHVTASLRAGGSVISGRVFDPFGISQALGRDEEVHGPDGSLDVTGNLLRDGNPAGTHDTAGWPTFTGWPVHDTYTHQQAYYRWLRRAWKSGLRLVVAQVVEDEPLCRMEPLRTHSCDETETIKLGIRRLHALENYVDAQRGGPGRGWFRLVYNPRQAREAIERGQLAVVIGTETSSPLGCSAPEGVPQCDREDIDRRLAELHRLGVRSMFIAHWVDNALAGPALQGGATGQFIAAMQLGYVGRPFQTEPCTSGDEADGTCNARGLTDLGAYLLRKMMRRHMLIEADHLSEKARARALKILAAKRYPVVSSHTGTGGSWTPSQLRTLRRLGGLPTATPSTATGFAEKIARLHRSGRDPSGGSGGSGGSVALGSDTGGFSALPGPREDADADPLRYPFRSFDGRVRFRRERTGRRRFDLNSDGVAHYGLFADLLADSEQHAGRRAIRPLFQSAEAYLRTWRRARRR